MPNDNKQQPTSSPPIIFTEDILPPMPQKSSGSSAPANDIVMPAVTITSTPKKKFASGKIIATILGLFLLIGGAGAGVFLVSQNQNIEEKAGSCESLNNGNGCGPGLRCNGNGGCVPVNASDDAATVKPKPWNEENNDKIYDGSCETQCGGPGLAFDFCLPAGSTNTCNQEALARGYTVQIATKDGEGYGSETWFCKTPPPNGASCDGKNGGVLRNDLKANSCFCGVLQVDTPDGFKSYKSECGCAGNNERSITEDTPTQTAQCQNIKAYSSTWTLLTNTQLGQLKTGDSVNFCVVGSASSGSFDKAKFTINGALQTDTTTKRPGGEDFCQLYTIPAGTTTFNVTAQIHHLTLGWK